MMKIDDTIAAIATPYGEGGIGIIRISGQNAKAILESIFVPAGKFAKMDNRKLTYGFVKDPEKNETIDEVMAVFMKSPFTYTCEDVAEIDCHGSVVSLKKTLELVLRSGARPAEMGEFTKRAFLNGRLDLSQAEAVMDVVSAKTEKSFDVAFEQLEGRIAREMEPLKKKILDLLAELSVNIDYPDEDTEEMTYKKLIEELDRIRSMTDNLLASADEGRMLREGINCVIIGKPNVGKSSLMNALLKESRAIVTNIPGTTRDTIEEMLNIRGIPVKLTDTAGIHETEDAVEKMGILKSKASFNSADLVIFMLDKSSPLDDADRELMKMAGSKKMLVLLNKTDLKSVIEKETAEKLLPGAKVIETSMQTREGVEAIENCIVEMVHGGQLKQENSIIITNVRHKDLLGRARSAINDARLAAESGEALDFAEMDVNRAYQAICDITGDEVSDDILNEVFARFCLGK